ncbi:condensation domain-containing protein [Streptomyces sp. NPDC102274]|uniref:condensation domain-containing protein n=1 Tax=Streptomyces sp. NPDC102274 TaxID=3366151 RepID=UPI00382DBE0F
MTASHSSHTSPDEPMTVVVDPGEPPYDTPAVLELRGAMDTGRLEAALDRIAARLPDGPRWQHRITYHGPGHHTVRLTTGTPGDVPVGLLADLLTDLLPVGTVIRTLTPSPLQRELMADADAHPGTGRHVEQLTWVWHGPLDPERFTAAWQALFDRESVLRAAFADSPEPRIVLHDHVEADVVRLPHGTDDWAALVERDRRRGLDPRRPGPLRVTVLGGGPAGSVTAPPTRVLLTYHHALLDDFSARLLLRGFCRAYLADGRLPGGERRPDLGDHAHWIAGQDTAAAREFWSWAAPPPDAAHSPLPAAEATATTAVLAPGGTGAVTGRARLRLTAAQTARLSAWAATWGSTESGALQAAWALLLYRATGSADAEAVRFSVALSGRGILMEGAERLPGALRNPLPMSVVVDPRSSVPRLLTALRDRLLDMAAYEWVSAGQIRAWTEAPDRPPGPPGSLVVFESRPRLLEGVVTELAAQGVRVALPETRGARTAFPVTLVAHHHDDGGLVVNVSYDRARFTGVTDVLGHLGRLMRELPRVADESTSIAGVLELMADGDAAHADSARDAGARADTDATQEEGVFPVITLRPARDSGAGIVCLLPSHHNPRRCYDLLARSYRGPEALVLLGSLPRDPRAMYTALRPLADVGGHLVLAGFSGCGETAYETARLIMAAGGRPPLLVLAAASTDADDFARLLEAAARRTG